jgi:hypothetical protein
MVRLSFLSPNPSSPHLDGMPSAEAMDPSCGFFIRMGTVDINGLRAVAKTLTSTEHRRFPKYEVAKLIDRFAWQLRI